RLARAGRGWCLPTTGRPVGGDHEEVACALAVHVNYREDGRMQRPLGREQFERIAAGQLTTPDGITYTRRTTKTARRVCDQRIGAGSPLVIYYWAAGQMDYVDGADGQRRWREVRSAVTQHPRSGGDVAYTAGIWVDGDGREIVVLTGHC
ncbi:hypothetical protein, partial [Frankia sp. Cr1]|uniref:hypothetical protein n=1 Tax=Frankia sp. Cr1 TaxID=3073931 RepID=UPI002AD4848B